TGFVAKLRPGEVVLRGVRQLDITDGPGNLFDRIRHAFVAFATDVARPVDRGGKANLVFPFGTHFGQIVREDKGRPRTVRAMHDGNGEVRECETGIQGLNAVIVPIADLLQVDVRQDFRRELDLPSLNALQIVDNRFGARNDRNVENCT